MRRKLSILLAVVIVLGSVAVPPIQAASRMWDLELLAQKYEQSGDTEALKPVYAELASLSEQAGNWINAAIYHSRLGKIFAAEQSYDQAVAEYDASSAAWSREGKVDEAINEKRYADAMRSTMEAFVTLKSETIGKQHYTGAKYEPIYGAYLGMYAESDEKLYNPYGGDQWFYTETVPKTTGKKHAGYLLYANINESKFPYSHAKFARKNGTFLQIALQPQSGKPLSVTKDNDWLRTYARDIKESGIPVFIRFACEMNLSDAQWLNTTPQEYIAIWRMVTKVFREEAPNVVMVWSPNFFPPYNIEQWYPGDEWVDWVGMSVYHIPDASWDPEQKMDRGEILTRLRAVYDLYADRKPIMLSETAISFYDHQTGANHEDWAIANMRRFYAGIPRLFPRVKAIFWWDVDHQSGKGYALANDDDFTITNGQKRLQAYSDAIADPFYLSDIHGDTVAPFAYASAAEAGLPAGECELSAHVKTFDLGVSRVEYTINGKAVGSATTIPYTVHVDTTAYAQQTVRLGLRAYNASGRLSAEREIELTVGAAQVTLDGKKLEFDVNPVSVNSRVLVPLRKIAESLGAQVGWANGRVTITRGSMVIALNDGDPVILRNGQAATLDSAPLTERGRMMVPVRAVTESFGLGVAWDETTKTVALTR